MVIRAEFRRLRDTRRLLLPSGMSPFFASVAGLVVLALVLLAVYVPSRDGKLDRNGAVGIRTRKTMASEEAWIAGHRASAPWLLRAVFLAAIAAVAGIALGVVLGPSPNPWQFFVHFIASYGAVVAAVLASARAANTAASKLE